MNDKLEYVIAELVRRNDSGDLTRLSELTGIHRRTLTRTISGSTTPKLDTLDVLYDLLWRNRKKAKL